MKYFSITVLVMLLISCATPATKGKDIVITPADSVHLTNCTMLGPVSIEVKSSSLFLWDGIEIKQEIQNRLRDAAAEQYPDADTLSQVDHKYRFGSYTEINGVAYKCFNK